MESSLGENKAKLESEEFASGENNVSDSEGGSMMVQMMADHSRGGKKSEGEYQLVEGDDVRDAEMEALHDNDGGCAVVIEEDDDEECVVPELEFMAESSKPWVRRLRNILTGTLVPDLCFASKICESRQSFQLLKFAAVTMLSVLLLHPLVRAVQWENDPNFTIGDFFLYDLHHVMLDIVSFFLIGRLYHKGRDFDRLLPYILPAIVGMIFPSWTNEIRFLQHSLSMYEVVCRWPWETFMFYIFLLAFIALIIFLHVRYAIKTKSVIRRLFELALSISLFILPSATNPNFHLHHWYVAWLLGVHANAPTWWSATAQAFAWGAYCNGIAVYGRDPILTCAYSFYVSTDIRCSYMSCYTHTDHNQTIYNDMDKPNWRNCSASGNYIP